MRALRPPPTQCTHLHAFPASTPSRRRQLPPPFATPTDDDAPDLVTRLFGGLFGKKALEDATPAGMKRLSGAALAEQYPATNEEAGPRDGDPPDIAPLRRLLKNTRLETIPLELAYDADVDGWSVDAFLAKVATRGANVVVATTEGGAVCGGYAPRSWLGLGEEKSAMSSFLFTWPDGNVTGPIKKLAKVGGPGLALIDRPGVGPAWGAEGLTIPLAAGDPHKAKCRLGTYYARLPDGGRSLFADGESEKGTQLTSLRVYVAAGDPEAWALDGVVWTSS